MEDSRHILFYLAIYRQIYLFDIPSKYVFIYSGLYPFFVISTRLCDLWWTLNHLMLMNSAYILYVSLSSIRKARYPVTFWRNLTCNLAVSSCTPAGQYRKHGRYFRTSSYDKWVKRSTFGSDISAKFSVLSSSSPGSFVH